MTAEAIIEELKTLPPTERAKVFAFVDQAMEADDSWIPESFKRGMADAAAGKLVDMETVINGVAPPARRQ
jgi:predicted transcriptional regulator